ncbi:hypothetical protein NE237_023715 [Protea cynaroides]|uniref:Uncharacterized protein n=1 Tax=Protea cynaroides TaxID=273540 RepID=A0A9Q0HEI5_9MAGN|nr:hypothetical protein NE237_023715 [Protea cynaroides]
MRKEEIRWEREGIRHQILKPGFEGYSRERRVSKLLEGVAQKGRGEGSPRGKQREKREESLEDFLYLRLEIVREKGLGFDSWKKEKQREKERKASVCSSGFYF